MLAVSERMSSLKDAGSRASPILSRCFPKTKRSPRRATADCSRSCIVSAGIAADLRPPRNALFQMKGIGRVS